MGRLENFEKYMDAIVEGKEKVEFPLRVDSDLLDDRKAENGMTKEKAKDLLDNLVGAVEDNHENDYDAALKMGIRAIDALEKIRADIRQKQWHIGIDSANQVIDIIDKYAEQEPKTGHCKECKYFEYDSVAKVYGVPLIVAREICNKWGDGCKTKEDGYCFLFEPQERSDKE